MTILFFEGENSDIHCTNYSHIIAVKVYAMQLNLFYVLQFFVRRGKAQHKK
jgi:hypothetical protein